MAYTVNFITLSVSKTEIIREMVKACMEQGVLIPILGETLPKNSVIKKWLNLEHVRGEQRGAGFLMIFS